MNQAPTVELRGALTTELDTVAELWRSSASLPGVFPAVMPTLQKLRARLDKELASGWKLTLAIREGEVVGMLALKPAISVLDQLFVRPSHIGTGVGKILLHHAKIEMPDGFTLHTSSTNQRARLFYEKEGLAFLREGGHPRSGHPVSYYGWKIR
jgi:ribosomal protein S18 acetylase RimI-like enzyme